MLRPILLAFLSDATKSSIVVIGLAALIGGVFLLLKHKADIDEVLENERDSNIQRFEQRKFGRRSLASSLIAAMGILMISLYWAHDPNTFIALISVVLLLLLAVMVLAFLDLMLVSLHAVTQDDPKARDEMVKEYLRQRQKLLDVVDESAPGDADQES
ncbi:MAG: hypothetical protein AAGA30_15305 [Planctomycetota bacterium]